MSQLLRVLKRWAIMNVVRPDRRRSVASIIAASVWISTELVGSSRINMGLFRRNARANEILWRSPPESRDPRSPTWVS